MFYLTLNGICNHVYLSEVHMLIHCSKWNTNEHSCHLNANAGLLAALKWRFGAYAAIQGFIWFFSGSCTQSNDSAFQHTADLKYTDSLFFFFEGEGVWLTWWNDKVWLKCLKKKKSQKSCRQTLYVLQKYSSKTQLKWHELDIVWELDSAMESFVTSHDNFGGNNTKC